MKTRIISFTEQGHELAGRLAEKLNAASDRCGESCPLRDWTRDAFANADALIYVGALGICVRSIAPYVQSKSTDPAVLAIDETGRYVISVLSGHLGGANDLARHIAELIGAEPVITTATDRRNVFPVDAWARLQGCAVENPGRIKAVSSRILEGGEIRILSDYPIEGEVPEHVTVVCDGDADVCVSIRRDAHTSLRSGEGTVRDPLYIVPKIVCAGIGCRRGVSERQIEEAVRQAFSEAGISECALAGVFSVDLKKDEEGITDFCKKRKVPFVTFSAEELRKAEGSFSASKFVAEITGVDNVCERSAVLGAENTSEGRLIFIKHVYDGVTAALALREFRPDFRWMEPDVWEQPERTE